MSSDTPWQIDQFRDGSSQQSRIKKALAPDYVAIDERSLRDLLIFIRSYASELQYFNENNQKAGDWQGFFPEDIDIDELLAFINNPSSIAESRAKLYRRPHFVLLLSFLDLLDHAKQQLNTLTKRHLDFYFQTFLQMQKKTAQADHVNVLIELAKHRDKFLLSAGTLLKAGKDSNGKALSYRTDNDVLISQAKIAEFRSTYVDKEYIDVPKTRELLIEKHGHSFYQEAFLEMLKINYGWPLPGDALPAYPGGIEIDYAVLQTLQTQANFISQSLAMKFSDFKELIRFKNQRAPSDDYPEQKLTLDQDWKTINSIIEKAGKSISRNFKIVPPNSSAFEKNLSDAVGPLNYDGLTLVENITELYQQRHRTEAEKFIKDNLHLALDDFVIMMSIKVRIDAQWQRINNILEQAASSKSGEIEVIPPEDSTAFADNLEKLFKLSSNQQWLPGIFNIDDLNKAIVKIEQYFFMSAYEFSYLMKTIDTSGSANISTRPTKDKWGSVYSILAEAYQKSQLNNRQQLLKKTAQKLPGENSSAIIASLLSIILNKTVSADQITLTLDELKSFFLANDFSYLTSINNERPVDRDWQRVYFFLAKVWQNYEGGEQAAEKITWQNIYALEDARTATVSLGLSDDNKIHRWDTFGKNQVTFNQATEFGWAMSSRCFFLSQGNRIITLTLHFSAHLFDSKKIKTLIDMNPPPFQVLASTEKDWINASPLDLSVGAEAEDSETRSLTFKFSFPATIDALTAPAEDSLSFSWPVIKILLNQIQPTEEDLIQRPFTHYQVFKTLQLQKVDIAVKTSGISDFLLKNDDKELKASKPFEPFGLKPSLGSKFYISHPEITYQNLTNITLSGEWLGLTESSIATHYQHYSDPKFEVNDIKAKLTMIDKSKSSALPSSLHPVFTPPSLNTLNISLNNTDLITAINSTWQVETAEEWDRYLECELNGKDFQHHTYPALIAQKSVELAAKLTATDRTDPIETEGYVLNPPYTPKLKQLTIGYTAFSSIDFIDDKLADDNNTGKVFHILPFGYQQVTAENNKPPYFIPQFENEGELYLGIEKLMPPQTLNLLFKVAEGSANADLTPEKIHWSYLSNNQWLSLDDGHVLTDTTRGLINSGIVELSLPKHQANTILAAELYWLKISIVKNSNSVCDIVAINTQAVTATFADNNNAQDHFNQPLAENTIKHLQIPNTAIKAIEQPYTSFGGKRAEQDELFYTRVSERLRHKNRAVNQWDYEHLILEHFPQIYKVKCLPARLSSADDKPGQVSIIVIPDIKKQLPFDPFEPKAPADMIADIENYLQDKTPASASIVVKNAHYIPVKIRMGIRFRSLDNVDFFKKQLNDELNRFLSPWAYEQGADIVIGGKIYANSIINFVEDRPYVDYVVEIKLFKGTKFSYVKPNNADGYYVTTDHPSEVLVAAKQHEFDLISDTGYEHESFVGINYMKIELDFQITE